MWTKLKRAAGTAYQIGVLIAFEAAYKADNAIADLKKSGNGMTLEVASSKRINIAGLENDIVIPQPTAEDRKWAREWKKASSQDLQRELEASIEKGDNWHALYLVNRPYRSLHVLGHASRGFSGNLRVLYATRAAAKADNVTGGYIMLKYAEAHPSLIVSEDGKVTDDMRDYDVLTVAYHGLRSAAANGADKLVQLYANTIGDFGKAYNRTRGEECFDYYLAECVVDMIFTGKTNQLDILLQKGVRAETFREAVMSTFESSGADDFGAQEVTTSAQRAVFTRWALSRKVIDQSFADAIVAQEKIEADAIAAAKADGSYYKPVAPTRRHFVSEDFARMKSWDDLARVKQVIMNYTRIDEEKVEADVGLRGERGVKHVFNFVAGTVTTPDKTVPLDEYRKDPGHAAEIATAAEQDWKAHQTLRRLPQPDGKRSLGKPSYRSR